MAQAHSKAAANADLGASGPCEHAQDQREDLAQEAIAHVQDVHQVGGVDDGPGAG